MPIQRTLHPESTLDDALPAGHERFVHKADGSIVHQIGNAAGQPVAVAGGGGAAAPTSQVNIFRVLGGFNANGVYVPKLMHIQGGGAWVLEGVDGATGVFSLKPSSPLAQATSTVSGAWFAYDDLPFVRVVGEWDAATSAFVCSLVTPEGEAVSLSSPIYVIIYP